MRRLVIAAVFLGCAGRTLGQESSSEKARRPAGYLLTPTPVVRVSYPAVQPYWPQPGDILVYDNDNKLFHWMFKVARSAPPTHASMVIARADGTPALLELAGPHTLTAEVCIMDVAPRLESYHGTIEVRRIRRPLTQEQSDNLTRFAESQVGKRFALWRCMLMATPLCPREGLRREWFGHTYQSRHRWFCSELVVAAGAHARLYDWSTYQANATTPRDLAVDELMDLSQLYHPPARWSAQPPSGD